LIGKKSIAKISLVLLSLSLLLIFLFKFIILVPAQTELAVSFDRRLDCERCGQHKAPPLTDVNMTITVTASSPVSGMLIDYYPVDWLVTDANGGGASSFNSSYNKIEWNIGDVNSIDKWYLIRSPDLTTPPTKYYFFSELANRQSDLWQVIVSDPPDTWSSKLLATLDDDNFATTDWGFYEILDASNNRPNFAGTLTKYAVKMVVTAWKGVDAADGIQFRHSNDGSTDAVTIGTILGDVLTGTGTYWVNSTESTLLSQVEHDGVAQEWIHVVEQGAIGAGEDLTFELYVYFEYTPDTTPPTWKNTRQNVSKVYRGEYVNLSTEWRDATNNLDFSWLWTNETDSTGKNYTDGTYGSPVDISGSGPVTVNFTWMNQTGSPKPIGWIIYANDTTNNKNGTDNPGNVIRNFTMWGWSNVTWNSPSSGSSYSLGSTIPLTCFVNDTNSSGSGATNPLEGYNVAFYSATTIAESYLGSNATNATGYATFYWTGAAQGTYFPKCNITDNATLFYTATNEYKSANTTVIVQLVTISVSLSTALSQGILFDKVDISSSGNPARNNTAGTGGATQYSFTLDSSSTSSASFYNKLTSALVCTGGTCTTKVSGSSTGSNSGFGSNTTFDTSYVGISNCNSITAGNNCWTRYYLNVSAGVSPGNYGDNTKYTWCANATSGSTAC